MIEKEPKLNLPIKYCIICLPDTKCQAIGSLGKIKARIAEFPYLNKKVFVWEKIEECSVRKIVMEAHKRKTEGILT